VRIWAGEGGFCGGDLDLVACGWSILAGGEICASARSWTDGEEKT
jgi:hypothetical protein